MSTTGMQHSSYFDLAQHNKVQVIIFSLFVSAGILIAFFWIFLPMMEFLFKVYLDGVVYNNNHQIVTDTLESTKERMTSYITLWAVDIYQKTPQEARYWFEPIISLFIPSTIFGILFAVIGTTILPSRIGFMHQKIDREVASMLAKISLSVYGVFPDEEPEEITYEIENANLRDLVMMSDKWKYSIEDLKTLRKCIKWREGSFIYKIFHLNHGLTMYMRFYFTVKYSNTVLGLVYMGAAALIIIIGLRGLKFIPSTQPSLVFFALGLEFSLLMTYAFTLIYGKQEEESETSDSNAGISSLSMFPESRKVNSKEVEKLLLAFIKKKKS